MAEQIPIAARTNQRREILLLVVLGFGSLVFSFGSMAMYIEPEEKPLEITLQSRPRTEPRSLEAGGDATAGERVRTETAATTPDSPAELPVEAPAATTAPPPQPETGVPAPAPSAPTVAPTPVPTTRAAAQATEPAPPPATRERVRILRRQVGGSTIEVHDFTHGVEYRGEVHDFRSGEPPRWIRDREKGSGR